MNNSLGNVYNNQGIITQGQQGNNTIIQAPARAEFTPQLQSEILQKIPKGPIELITVGGEADQAIGNQVHAFLNQSGYTVTRTAAGIYAPPPSHPYSMAVGTHSTLIVAPSAR